VREAYLEAIRLTERLHRQFLEVVKSELDRLGIEDINNVQALILFNISAEELTVGELTHRGYYLGSNVSYNVRKMVESGYLQQERSTHDRRSIRVRLTAKGLALCEKISVMFARQVESVADVVSTVEVDQANQTYRRLERFWVSLLNYAGRPSI
jgi:DNA-binding MarR family transcriptional regulator